MTYSSEPRFLVLHALRIKGLAPVEAVAAAVDTSTAAAAEVLDAAAAGGLVEHRTGGVTGFRLTPSGKAAHAEGLTGNDSVRPAVQLAFDGFLELDAEFKRVCTDWQVRPGDGDPLPNDHSDPDYDAAIVARLAELHERVVAVIEPVARSVPRFDAYRVRFTGALQRLHAGSHAAFARPMSDSYHDIWMELHQDFLLTLGRDRTAADGT